MHTSLQSVYTGIHSIYTHAHTQTRIHKHRYKTHTYTYTAHMKARISYRKSLSNINAFMIGRFTKSTKIKTINTIGTIG